MEFLEYNDVSAEIKGAMVNFWAGILLKHANDVCHCFVFTLFESSGIFQNSIILEKYRIYFKHYRSRGFTIS